MAADGGGTIATADLRVISTETRPRAVPSRIALCGNPNSGKTTLFNALTGLRAKTANYPGTTIERRTGRARFGDRAVEILDLPGSYSLSSEVPEERLAREVLEGRLGDEPRADAVILLVDATHLERNLYLASQVLELGVPTVVALNMVDLARRRGIDIDVDRLASELGCPVVPVAARTGAGLDALRREVAALLAERAPDRLPAHTGPDCSCAGCPFRARFDWAERVGSECASGGRTTKGSQTEWLDELATHPVVGVVAFLFVMFAVFAMIFWIAQYPMGWIESGFAFAASMLEGWIPEGDLRSLVVEGILGGVGGVLVFLPQICILFLFLTLLEDTGYLARAAFVMDRLMRRVGLPGKAFVPMLSAHACAVPAVMSARVIEDRRDRLVTILVLPFLTCSARIPIFAMLTTLLFPHRPLVAGLVFTAAYAAGVVATLAGAFALKRTLLPGEAKPLVLELPSYKLPSLRTAMLTSLDRARVFVGTAGTVILVLSIALWAFATYPKSDPPPDVAAWTAEAARARAEGRTAEADVLDERAERLASQSALANSLAGRVGRTIEPALRPLGFDWQIGVGVLMSFAAREVIVSTLAIIYGVGENGESASLYDKLADARRTDGTPVYTPATCVSLIVFYVLALQCMSTVAVVRRETNGWRWPVAQFVAMGALAWLGAFVSYQLLASLGLG
jgi:ferrous iron transport protein B